MEGVFWRYWYLVIRELLGLDHDRSADCTRPTAENDPGAGMAVRAVTSDVAALMSLLVATTLICAV